jgi:hypothetical protein
MKKAVLVFTVFLIALNLSAQQSDRIMDLPAKQTPTAGQSLYVFSVSMKAGRSVIISIDDNRIGHFFDGETAEIAVPNGKHVVRAYQMKWNDKTKMWNEDDDDRLTNTLKDVRFPVDVRAGPSLRTGRETKLAQAIGNPSQASGKSTATATTTRPASNVGIEGAVARASVALVGELPANSTIAVISISSRNTDLAAFAIDELEYQLVTSRQFTIVDRKTLDTIRSEQNFQVSGEVSDQSAVSIGNLLGASIVITGTISGTDNTQRLTLKALNVKTAQIMTMARESF